MTDEKQELYDAVMISPDTSEKVKWRYYFKSDKYNGACKNCFPTDNENCMACQKISKAAWMERARVERIKQ